MGLDDLVEARDRQIVDKDVETGEWGLTEQIENSARGHIPDDPQLLLQRMEDEKVRQALDRGCARNDIIDVFDVSRRTTFNKLDQRFTNLAAMSDKGEITIQKNGELRIDY